MTIDNRLSYSDLVRSVNEYHYQVFGEPLHLAGEPISTLYETLKAIEQYIVAMQQSFTGRELMRTRGWSIEEHEPLLQQIALERAGEREFDDNNYIVSTRVTN